MAVGMEMGDPNGSRTQPETYPYVGVSDNIAEKYPAEGQDGTVMLFGTKVVEFAATVTVEMVNECEL